MKALKPKSEKCIFVGYSVDFKGYRILQPHCTEIIIRRDVKFDENILSSKPNLTFVTYLAYEPNSTFVPSSTASHLRHLCLPLFWFLLQMMTMRMKIHLCLLTFLQMSSLNLNQYQLQLHHFLDGSVQNEKPLVILSVILHISIKHVHSSSVPLLFWLKF
jgi:hypothetical protein